MPLFPPKIINFITKSVYWADRFVRSDLIRGYIADENDYTSNLTCEIRRQINSKNCPNLHAISIVMKPSFERKTGSDACIILSNQNEFKICLFEAKWPRLSTHKDYWDYIQIAAKQSHFSEQIKKQHTISRTFAIWEMFYCEFEFMKQPHWLNDFHSSCIWHDDAYLAFNSRNNSNKWTDIELENLIITANNHYKTTIDNLVNEVCQCNKGKVFNGNDYFSVFEEMAIPQEALLIEYTSSEE